MQTISSVEFTALFPSLTLGLSDAETQTLIASLEPEEIAAGETPIVQGTESDSLYLVWEGALKVSVQSGTGEHEVATLTPGALFGEVTILDPGPASATVRSDGGCRALVLPHSKLSALWTEHHKIALKLLAHLNREVTSRIRSTSIQLHQNIAKKSQAKMLEVN